MPFFSKILVKSQKKFEKCQENFSKKSGKISQLDLWQPWIRIVNSYSNWQSPDFFLNFRSRSKKAIYDQT